jgi:leader peptidase (prepilin peptidase)/N-methyltransferase
MSVLNALAILVLGLVVGSFLNVVIYRLPRGESIIRPRSFCRSCGKHIRWYENIPILSYVFLRGRCGVCGSPISPRYPVIEFFGGILAVLVFWRFGPSIHALFAYAFVMALFAVTVIDWEHRIIPDEISISFMLIGVVWSFLNPGLSPWESAIGALAGGGGLYAVGLGYRMLRKVDGLGGGDVKLMAMIGAFLGVKLVLPVLVIASFAGSVYGVIILRRGGGGKAAVAFGAFLAPAAALCLFYGTPILAWYFARF